MNLVSIALTGFFVWTGMTASTTPIITPAPTPPLVESTAPLVQAKKSTSRSVKLTAYNAVPEQTDDTPFITASGIKTNHETIAARSRDLADALPFGTIIALESPQKSNSCGFSVVDHLIGYRVIADTMHERKREQIDILLNENDTVMIGVSGQPKKETNPARALGICHVTYRVVGKISIKDVPETQAELAAMVEQKLARR